MIIVGCKVLQSTLVDLKATWLQNPKTHKNIAASQKACISIRVSMCISLYYMTAIK